MKRRGHISFVTTALWWWFTLSFLPTRNEAAYSATLAYGPTNLLTPTGIAIDPNSNAIYIVDYGNNRVLRFYDRTSLNPSTPITFAFGQSSVTGNSSATTPTGLYTPWGAFVDVNGVLWISDYFNNRVLFFNHAANLTTMPAVADGVLGQPSFNTGSPNAGVPVSNNNMNLPTGLRADGTSLWVSDSGNHR